MATFSSNIRKIRGEATYGPEMRKAIADAILQALNVEIQEIETPYPDSDKVYVTLTPLEYGSDDYTMSIVNQSS